MRIVRPFIICFLVVAALSSMPAARATTITIINKDGAGVGFNDPTVVSPVGGNPGRSI